MSTAIVVVHVVATILLIIVVLIQSGKADMGIGFGSSSQSIFGSQGAGNFLTKLTSVIATIFIVTSFVLTWQKIHYTEKSIIDSVEVEETQPQTKKTSSQKEKNRASKKEDKEK